MSLTWPNRQLTLEEWAALPAAEGVRLELVEGLVVMAPMPLSWHQKAAMRIGYRLDEQLPADLTALTEVEVVLVREPATVRIPDVMVTGTSLYETNPPRYSATDVLLVVEILSDGTRRVDRMVTFAEYAEAGIPQYWIVDVGSPCTLLCLRPGRRHTTSSPASTAARSSCPSPGTRWASTSTR